MPDAQIHPTGVVAAPGDYKIPPAADLLLKAVFATFDGGGAASPFVPLLRIISDAGSVVAEVAADVTVAAGASADTTWFPHVAAKQASSGGGIQFDTDNVGDWLEVETSGLVADSFSQPNAGAGLETQFGAALNIDNGLLITAPPDSTFNSGNPILDVESDVKTGDLGGFGQLIRVQDKTPSGTNQVTAQQIIAGADGSQNVTGSTVEADMGNAATADAFGIAVIANNTGTGREVALSSSTGGSQSGANSLALLCIDDADNPIFEVRNDGSVHIKTGTTVVADL